MKIKGGDKLEGFLNQLKNKLGKQPTLQVGFLPDAKYPDGTPVGMVAAIQNFGAPAVGIPPRPFFSNMIKDKSPDWGKLLAHRLKQVNYKGDAALGLVGDDIAGQLRQSIVDTNSPPLSPVTLMLRKMKSQNPDLIVTGRTVGEAAKRVAAGLSYAGVSTKPLVAPGVGGGHMLASVDYNVKS